MTEADFIAALRRIATHPAARGLMDDAAVLDMADGALVLTHDMLVEGVHFLPDSPAASVGWKLVAANMSDLSAKGAAPVGVLMGCGLNRDSAWAEEFREGVSEALSLFDVPLLGGDTVRMPEGAPLTLGMTAIGLAPKNGAPSRSGARPGDDLWVTGTIGDAGLGLALSQGKAGFSLSVLHEAYNRPQPNLAFGQDVAPLVSAMADVSDGLLIDAQRIAAASGCGIAIDIGAVPLSSAFVMSRPDTLESRLFAATAGDDYQLLFTAPPDHAEQIEAIGMKRGAPVTRLGTCVAGAGLALSMGGQSIPLPARLGYQH